MRDVIQSVIDSCDVDKTTLSGNKCLVLVGCAVYLDGCSGIITFTENEIELKTKKGKVFIKGEKMYLKQITKQDIIVKGKINSVTVE